MVEACFCDIDRKWWVDWKVYMNNDMSLDKEKIIVELYNTYYKNMITTNM